MVCQRAKARHHEVQEKKAPANPSGVMARLVGHCWVMALLGHEGQLAPPTLAAVLRSVRGPSPEDAATRKTRRIADDFARSLAAHTKETLAVRIVLIAPDA